MISVSSRPITADSSRGRGRACSSSTPFSPCVPMQRHHMQGTDGSGSPIPSFASSEHVRNRSPSSSGAVLHERNAASSRILTISSSSRRIRAHSQRIAASSAAIHSRVSTISSRVQGRLPSTGSFRRRRRSRREGADSPILFHEVMI